MVRFAALITMAAYLNKVRAVLWSRWCVPAAAAAVAAAAATECSHGKGCWQGGLLSGSNVQVVAAVAAQDLRLEVESSVLLKSDAAIGAAVLVCALQFGFIPWFSSSVVDIVSGLGLTWQPAFGIILVLYFYSHYFFASGEGTLMFLNSVTLVLGGPCNVWCGLLCSTATATTSLHQERAVVGVVGWQVWAPFTLLHSRLWLGTCHASASSFVSMLSTST